MKPSHIITRSPLASSSAYPTCPPPPRPSRTHHSWNDAQLNIIRTPSVQGFYPPAYSVDWASIESAAGSTPQRLLAARHYHPHHGQNIVVDYMTSNTESTNWVHYTVIYLQSEPSPFDASSQI